MEKSERKTLFLSFLDGTEEEVHHLSEVLKDLGIQDEYRVLISAKPMQALNEYEVADMMEQWYGTKGIDDTIRLNNIRHSLHFIEETLKSLAKRQTASEANFQQIESSFSNLHKSLIGNLANGATPNAYFNRLINGNESETKAALDNLERYTPKEGAEW